MHRKRFLENLSALTLGYFFPAIAWDEDPPESWLAKKLHPVGRILEQEGYYVWCNSPVVAPDGTIHVFFSRWNSTKGMGGWINGSEIVHATAASPEGPYEIRETVLQPRPGYWDATTCHNPLIREVDGRYYLFFMGNSNGKTNTKRIGLAVADSLNGPWKRPDQCLLEPGAPGAWDDHCTTNPAFVKVSDNEYRLYYKSWNTHDYETDPPPIRGNRKYGLAIAHKPEGPYTKHPQNPLIDYSGRGNNAQLEDGFVFKRKHYYAMIARDMGYYNHECGILIESRDGISWNPPKIAYYKADKYISQPPAPKHLTKYGRFERPQILFVKGKPAWLFCTSQGGKYETSSPFLFRIG